MLCLVRDGLNFFLRSLYSVPTVQSSRWMRAICMGEMQKNPAEAYLNPRAGPWSHCCQTVTLSISVKFYKTTLILTSSAVLLLITSCPSYFGLSTHLGPPKASQQYLADSPFQEQGDLTLLWKKKVYINRLEISPWRVNQTKTYMSIPCEFSCYWGNKDLITIQNFRKTYNYISTKARSLFLLFHHRSKCSEYW